MALIKCSNCSREIDDTIEDCPYCGWHVKKKRKNKRLFIFFAVFVVIAAGAFCIIKPFIDSQNLADQVIEMIEADYGEKIDVRGVYYKEEENGCIIKFTSRGRSDIACVHLEDNTVGYESIYEIMSEKLDDVLNDASSTEEEIRRYAKQAVEYPYEVIWIYDLNVNGTEVSGWDRIR